VLQARAIAGERAINAKLKAQTFSIDKMAAAYEAVYCQLTDGTILEN
jgi:hypothetical protein